MQTITSAKTSRKQVPELHKGVTWFLHGNILDYGGGKFDTAKEWAEKENSNIKLFVYDPYNRSEEHNKEVLKNEFNTVICANVLNVIKEREIRLSLLEHINSFNTRSVYFDVYNAKKANNYVKNEGQETRDGWQNCKPLKAYMDEIKLVFKMCSVVLEKKYIVVLR